eukprot:TRINITY_DN5381_c0_g1_i2.p1 TRINITY_DN5381_c0_g1~~TRINITY_DN5381_c0_g1_i2.p1  ORF type:complete len:101 (+),score=12.84 TRINITY_DN5381_c0_g1_i2:189-491(+)
MGEKASAPADVPRTEFFRALDDAVNTFNECHANFQQGGHFHAQFATHITKLHQTINDYIMSRTMEKNDMVNQMSGMNMGCLLYTSPSPRDLSTSRMPSSA